MEYKTSKESGWLWSDTLCPFVSRMWLKPLIQGSESFIRTFFFNPGSWLTGSKGMLSGDYSFIFAPPIFNATLQSSIMIR